MDQIVVVPLGISAGSPTPERHVSSLAVVMDGRVVLFDCGEGTQYQLMRAPFRWSHLDAIFITHLHGDHLYGLPGLLGTLTLHHHDSPLAIYGPPPLRTYLESVIETTRLHLSYPVEIVEVDEGEVRSVGGYSVVARGLDHGIPSFGYRLQERDRPGTLNAAKLMELGVPEGPLYGRIKSGEDIALDDGTTIHARDIVGPPRKGRSIVYCLDTRPCDAAVELARDASLLVHEATYGDEYALEARERGHATATEAARVAAQARVAHLLLTHFSPRYLDLETLVDEAKEVFPATVACEELVPVRVP